MSSIWGNKIKVSIFGESHGEAIGVTIDGLPSGVLIDMDKILHFMSRRQAKGDAWATSRTEADIPRVLSGLYNKRTTGSPLCAIIENKNTRSQDYSQQDMIPRPGHADLTAMARFEGYQDPRGGGHFSGRLTAPLVFAGAICSQILEEKRIFIFAHIESIGDINDQRFDSVNFSLKELAKIQNKPFPVYNDEIAKPMIDKILQVKSEQDSIGGVVECMAVGFPCGLGSPMFESIEARISSIMFGIPAVKGIEFGAGFAVAKKMASENNDVPYFIKNKMSNNEKSVDESLSIRYKTNNAGGIEGGISNGMPVLFRLAFKPTPSISKEQESINLAERTNIKFNGKGRHDPCIVPRAVPVVEAAMAIVLLDLM